jgi:hypothetical protein
MNSAVSVLPISAVIMAAIWSCSPPRRPGAWLIHPARSVKLVSR